ncbi:hypothetical protein MJT46_019159 [Ovis ammon polii x Ovis aries]|nr:hypothetical protein MJT46_019159 [Ovis ammon polii x Ovis aries]
MQKMCMVETQAGLMLVQAPVEVLLDLCLKEDTADETLSYLLKKDPEDPYGDPVDQQLPAFGVRTDVPVTVPECSLLKDLEIIGVNLTSLSLEPLQIVIERNSATLKDLDLDKCGTMYSQFSALLPSLSCCFQLTTFSFSDNLISMSVLESQLHHTEGLSKLSLLLYPASLESYEDVQCTMHLGLLAQVHARIKQLMELELRAEAARSQMLCTDSSIRRILKLVKLDSVHDLEVNCTLKLDMLGRFLPHLGRMGNLCHLLLSHIHVLLHTTPDQEEHWVSQLTAQFLNLPHQQELYLDSISFLEG